MKCPKCQFENDPDKKFCIECGKKLALRCPECDSGLKGNEKFCGERGYDLSGSSSPPNVSFWYRILGGCSHDLAIDLV
jgi:hypothetical protein